MSRVLQTIMIDARAIWTAARVPGAKPLDDDEAAELARRLQWAKTWYQNAQPDALAREENRPKKVSTAGENERLKKAIDATKELTKCFCAAKGVTLERILSRVDPSLSGLLTSENVLAMISAIQSAAEDALKHERGDIALRRIYGSPEKLYIRSLAKIYVDFAKQNPKYKTEEEDHGDFPRFVKAASDGLNLPCPSFTTIRNARRDCGAEWPAVGVEVGSKKRRGQH